MSYTIVTFCTAEYGDCIAHWRDKCKELAIANVNYELESTGDWGKNTRLKAKVLWHARNTIRGSLLYFDIDGRLLARPTEPVANLWDFGIIQNPRVEHRTKLSSQCFWIADTLAARKVLAWWDYLVVSTGRLDHPLLAHVLKFAESKNEAKVIRVDDEVRNCWQFNGQRPRRSQTTLTECLSS